MDSRKRRELATAGARLKARLTVAPGEPSDALLAHVARAFAGADLLKVRVNTGDRSEAEELGAQLARRLPCELVSRTGFVLLLYRPP